MSGRAPGQIRAALGQAGLTLPTVTAPVAAYVPAVRAGNLIHTAGQLPLRDGAPTHHGLVGPGGLPTAEAAQAAAVAALGALAAALAEVAEDEVVRAIRLMVFVAVEPSFTQMPAVANGASEVLQTALGEPHARTAVGVISLPLNVPVELDVLFSVDPAE